MEWPVILYFNEKNQTPTLKEWEFKYTTFIKMPSLSKERWAGRGLTGKELLKLAQGF